MTNIINIVLSNPTYRQGHKSEANDCSVTLFRIKFCRKVGRFHSNRTKPLSYKGSLLGETKRVTQFYLLVYGGSILADLWQTKSNHPFYRCRPQSYVKFSFIFSPSQITGDISIRADTSRLRSHWTYEAWRTGFPEPSILSPVRACRVQRMSGRRRLYPPSCII